MLSLMHCSYVKLYHLTLSSWHFQSVINMGRLGWNGHVILLKLISGEHIGALAMSEPNCEFLFPISISISFSHVKVLLGVHSLICA